MTWKISLRTSPVCYRVEHPRLETVTRRNKFFLSKKVMSLVTNKMPQLAIRILKGYNDPVLTHMVEFDNGAENPW